jgi:Zn-dependent protease
MEHIKYRCAIVATIFWVIDGGKVARDQLSTGNADWVPFLAFTGLMILLAIPVLLSRGSKS